MKKILIVMLSAMLVLGFMGCQNSNPLTDPTNPMNPSNPESPLNPDNPNNPFVDHFTSDEAYAVADTLVDGLDKGKIADRFMSKLDGVQVDDIKLGEYLTVKFTDSYDVNGETSKKYETTPDGLTELMTDMGMVPQAQGTIDPRNIESMDLDVVFTNMMNVYKGELALNADASISGTIKLTILPATMSIEEGNVNVTALIKLSTSDLELTYGGNTYGISLDVFNTLYTSTGFSLPGKNDNTQSFTVSYKGETQTINWATLSGTLDDDTAWYAGTGSIEEAATVAYYGHFGSLGFLHDLYSLFADDDNAIDTISMTNESFAVTDGNGTLSLTLGLKDYAYYTDGSNQRASGNVTLVFTGTITENTFKATAFTVESDGITLSDVSKTFNNLMFTISEAEGTIGTDGTNKGLAFTVTGEGSAESPYAVSGIKYYYQNGDTFADGLDADAKEEYSASNHSLNADNIG